MPHLFLAFSVDRKLAILLYSIRRENVIAVNCFGREPSTFMEEAKGPSNPKGKAKTAAPGFDTETLNFKVTTQFKKEFKGYAVSQGITMLELLKEGFELSKHKRRQ